MAQEKVPLVKKPTERNSRANRADKATNFFFTRDITTRDSVTLTSIGGISSDTTHSEEQALCRRIDVRKTSIVWCNQESFRFYTLLRRDCDEEHVTAYRQTVEMSTLVGRAMPSFLSVLEELCL